MSDRVNFIQVGPGGVCFAHGAYSEQQCPYWPKCITDPQQDEYLAMGIRTIRMRSDAPSESVIHYDLGVGQAPCGAHDKTQTQSLRLHLVTCIECLRLKAQALPPGGMTIQAAIEKIRSAESLKGRHRTIDMEIVVHDESVEVIFGVWAGNQEFKGATIENAVNSCLVSNNEFSGTAEEAERVVREAAEYQERL